MIEALLTRALRAHGARTALVGHTGPGSAQTAGALAREPGVRVLDLGRGGAGGGTGWRGKGPVDLLAVVAAASGDLRAAVPRAERLPSATGFAVVVRSTAPSPIPPLVAPPGLGEWSDLLYARTRRLPGGGWLWEFSFSDPVEAWVVLSSVARGLVGGRRGPGHAPSGAGDRPVTVPTWARLGGRGAVTRAARVSRLSVEDVPVVDERVVNPMGFTRTSSSRVGRLVSRGGRWVLVAGGRVWWRVPEDGSVSDVDVAALRDLRAVRVEWGRHSGPVAAVRAVASLAASGIPLVGARPPLWARPLGEELHDLLAWSLEEELDDELIREEHSVRLRRAALRVHGAGGRAWLRAGAGGAVVAPEPSVSVVLCTRRPEMVGFALRQVARQRGVRVEVVLALHGFGPDAPGVAAAVAEYRRGGRALVVWEPPGDLVFGSVLNGAIERASGTLLAKMDDDDWYGPDHLSDLLLARRYSGAELVGGATEYHHLEHLGLTVRRLVPSERFAQHVTGAAILTDRTTLEEVGGFRPWRASVDAGLLDDVRDAGGSTYRTHGLGCVVRRRSGGHTWSEAPGYFLREPLRQWRGWRPSALLESRPEDAPGPVPETTPDSPTAGSDR
ncbi:glycosyltransferase [Nocardiopsis sp. NPDC006938]|uniref:glycosyltransferase n=1 Tax=Nocardiopsis sp. NPDC006938 TaxID=3364337 RepID=UPI0036A24F29